MFRRRWEGLPKDYEFESDLESLGFFVNDQDQIRSISHPEEYFQYRINRNDRYNERRVFHLNQAIEEIVHKRLVDKGLKKVQLPYHEDCGDSAKVPIFISENLAEKSRVVIIINDTWQDLGVLAHRVVGSEGGINKGSMVSIIEALQEQSIPGQEDSSPGIIIANIGQTIWDPVSQRAMTLRAFHNIQLPSLVHHGQQLDSRHWITHHKDPNDHIHYIFTKVLQREAKPNCRLDFIAIGFGAEELEQYLDGDGWRTHGKFINTLTTIGGMVDGDNLTDEDYKKFRTQRSRAWVACEAPVGTPLANHLGNPNAKLTFADHKVAAVYSGGTSVIELIFIHAMKPILSWLQDVARVGKATNYTHPKIVVTYTDRLQDEVNWDAPVDDDAEIQDDGAGRGDAGQKKKKKKKKKGNKAAKKSFDSSDSSADESAAKHASVAEETGKEGESAAAAVAAPLAEKSDASNGTSNLAASPTAVSTSNVGIKTANDDQNAKIDISYDSDMHAKTKVKVAANTPPAPIVKITPPAEEDAKKGPNDKDKGKTVEVSASDRAGPADASSQTDKQTGKQESKVVAPATNNATLIKPVSAAGVPETGSAGPARNIGQGQDELILTPEEYEFVHNDPDTHQFTLAPTKARGRNVSAGPSTILRQSSDKATPGSQKKTVTFERGFSPAPDPRPSGVRKSSPCDHSNGAQSRGGKGLDGKASVANPSSATVQGSKKDIVDQAGSTVKKVPMYTKILAQKAVPDDMAQKAIQEGPKKNIGDQAGNSATKAPVYTRISAQKAAQEDMGRNAVQEGPAYVDAAPPAQNAWLKDSPGGTYTSEIPALASKPQASSGSGQTGLTARAKILQLVVKKSTLNKPSPHPTKNRKSGDLEAMTEAPSAVPARGIVKRHTQSQDGEKAISGNGSKRVKESADGGVDPQAATKADSAASKSPGKATPDQAAIPAPQVVDNTAEPSKVEAPKVEALKVEAPKIEAPRAFRIRDRAPSGSRQHGLNFFYEESSESDGAMTSPKAPMATPIKPRVSTREIISPPVGIPIVKLPVFVAAPVVASPAATASAADIPTVSAPAAKTPSTATPTAAPVLAAAANTTTAIAKNDNGSAATTKTAVVIIVNALSDTTSAVDDTPSATAPVVAAPIVTAVAGTVAASTITDRNTAVVAPAVENLAGKIKGDKTKVDNTDNTKGDDTSNTDFASVATQKMAAPAVKNPWSPPVIYYSSSYKSPAERASAAKATAAAAPVRAAPAKAAPAKAPAKAAPAKAAPAKAAPAKAAPAKAAPAKAAPARAAPVRAAPVEAAPVKAAPFKATPVVVITAAKSPVATASAGTGSPFAINAARGPDRPSAGLSHGPDPRPASSIDTSAVHALDNPILTDACGDIPMATLEKLYRYGIHSTSAPASVQSPSSVSEISDDRDSLKSAPMVLTEEEDAPVPQKCTKPLGKWFSPVAKGEEGYMEPDVEARMEAAMDRYFSMGSLMDPREEERIEAEIQDRFDGIHGMYS